MEQTDDSIMLTIHCLVYNHEPYIRQCLDGFVKQKTNFSFEAIVHDDASTDHSVDIIREYAQKYPNIIKPVFETENQYSKHNGSIRNILEENTKGKYVAMCEGDDYWIDPYKLQKQVDFLENHPECVYSCHRYLVYNDNTKEKYLIPNKYFDAHPSISEFTFDLSYPFLQEWITKTLTCVYRHDCFDTSIVKKYKYYRDVHLVYYLLLTGKGVCHSFVGGVYRKNSGSIFGSQTYINQLKIAYTVYSEMYSVTKNCIFKRILRSIYLRIFVKEKKISMPLKRFELETLLLYLPYKILKRIFVGRRYGNGYL